MTAVNIVWFAKFQWKSHKEYAWKMFPLTNALLFYWRFFFFRIITNNSIECIAKCNRSVLIYFIFSTHIVCFEFQSMHKHKHNPMMNIYFRETKSNYLHWALILCWDANGPNKTIAIIHVTLYYHDNGAVETIKWGQRSYTWIYVCCVHNIDLTLLQWRNATFATKCTRLMMKVPSTNCICHWIQWFDAIDMSMVKQLPLQHTLAKYIHLISAKSWPIYGNNLILIWSRYERMVDHHRS